MNISEKGYRYEILDNNPNNYSEWICGFVYTVLINYKTLKSDTV